MKIGTHNSCTGEKPKGLLSLLVTPFAKCQSLTLAEQHEAGCRWFDIRAKMVDGYLHPAHGLWICARTLDDVLQQLSSYGDCIVGLTYEGRCDEAWWDAMSRAYADRHTKIRFVYSAIKKPKWKELWRVKNAPCSRANHIKLDWAHWYYMPLLFPWLINRLFTHEQQFDDSIYTIVDFLQFSS